MDKSRILWLQQRKALKECRSQITDESRAAAESSVGTGSPLALRETTGEPRKKKRTPEEEQGLSGKELYSGKKQLRLIDESDDAELISSHGYGEGVPIAEEKDPSDDLPLSVRLKGAIPTEGKEMCTLIRFEATQGWLGSNKEASAPVGTLSAFELSSDKKSLGKASYGDSLFKAKEAFGVVCFVHMLVFQTVS